MSYLTQPVARVKALVEGRYPVTPVAGRSVPLARFKATRLHGELTDPEFPSAHFHRAYSLIIESSGQPQGEPRTNARAGQMRRLVRFRLRIGYLFGRDAAGRGKTSEEDARILGHGDHETIAQALRHPSNWSGTDATIYSLARDGSEADVAVEVIDPLARIIVDTSWRMELAFNPQRDWETP